MEFAERSCWRLPPRRARSECADSSSWRVMHELTEPQAECERRLSQVLAKLSTSIVDRQVVGQSETYVTGRIAGTMLVVFIYDDGEAQIHGPKSKHIFERADFPNGGIETLWDAFEERVRNKSESRGAGRRCDALQYPRPWPRSCAGPPLLAGTVTRRPARCPAWRGARRSRSCCWPTSAARSARRTACATASVRRPGRASWSSIRMGWFNPRDGASPPSRCGRATDQVALTGA